MKDRARPYLDEGSLDGIHIGEIPPVQRDVRPESRVVGRHLPDKSVDLVTFAAQLLRYMAPNESRDARYQNALAHRFLSYAARRCWSGV